MADLVTEWFMEPSVRTNYRTMVYYKGDGQDTFEINFEGGFIYKEDVKAFSVKDDTRERKNHKVTFVNGSVSRVKLDSAIPKGWTVCIYRDTPKAKPLAQFTDGAIINEANLDRNAQQAMFAVSEMVDRFDSTVESVESALKQVYEANEKADQAIVTANNANSTANTAVGIANGAVTTANEAKQSAANANTTANSAVKTANEAKSIAQGLDGQIKQANTTANNAVTKADSAIATANEAKTTANGIDAKATKALNDSAQALIVANGIDGKATKAQKDAAEALSKANDALASQGIAKELTDRVASFPTAINVNWKGPHRFVSEIAVSGFGGSDLYLQGTNKDYGRVSHKNSEGTWTILDIKSKEAYINNALLYHAGSLNPYFADSVITRRNGYYSRYSMINSTNNDKVDLIQNTDNCPYLESRSGSNGSIQYQWYFPRGGGTVLTDKSFNKFQDRGTETWTLSPNLNTYISVRDYSVGVFIQNKDAWGFKWESNSFSLFGVDEFPTYRLAKSSGSSVFLGATPTFFNIFQRDPSGKNTDVVTFPKPSGGVDSVVYEKDVYKRDQVYTKTQTYAKSEVYNKTEADTRFMAKGTVTGTKLGPLKYAPSVQSAEEQSITGTHVYKALAAVPANSVVCGMRHYYDDNRYRIDVAYRDILN